MSPIRLLGHVRNGPNTDYLLNLRILVFSYSCPEHPVKQRLDLVLESSAEQTRQIRTENLSVKTDGMIWHFTNNAEVQWHISPCHPQSIEIISNSHEEHSQLLVADLTRRSSHLHDLSQSVKESTWGPSPIVAGYCSTDTWPVISLTICEICPTQISSARLYHLLSNTKPGLQREINMILDVILALRWVLSKHRRSNWTV